MSPTFRRWYFSRRGFLLIPPYSVLLLCFWRVTDKPEILWPVGFALIAVGAVPRLWASVYIGRSSWTRRERAEILITGGPYGLCRNPLYVGNILIALGFGVLSGLIWYMPILFAILVLHYSIVVRCEESFLEERFGEVYRAYRAQVSRWIPQGFSPRTHSEAKCTLRDVLGREWLRILALIAAGMAVFARELVAKHFFTF